MDAAPHRTTSEDSVLVRRGRLDRLHEQARQCTRCPQLAANRTTVVFGTGDRDAGLMLVNAPSGQNEDRQGLPLVGAAGRLLTELLAEVGLERDELYISNVLKCRPPQNRDPLAEELAHCRSYLDEQVALVQPRVVCSLGSLATKVLRGDPAGIKQVRGTVEVRTIGARAVRLLPLMHPDAALYHRATLDLLRADLAQLPALLALPAPVQPEPTPDPVPVPESASKPAVEPKRRRAATGRRDDRARADDDGEQLDAAQPAAEPAPSQLPLF
jgi:uracil-DNA glycosylase family 4